MKKNMRNYLLILSLWILVLTVGFLFQSMPKKVYGVIDTQSIVAIEAQKIAALYSKNDIPPEKLQIIAEKLKEKVEFFANKQNLVLLAKGAVWGGDFPDYTDRVIEFLQEE